MVCRDVGNVRNKARAIDGTCVCKADVRRNADVAEQCGVGGVNERTAVRAGREASAELAAGLGSDAHGAGARERRPVMYGYARVSSADQNLDRQLDALLDSGWMPGVCHGSPFLSQGKPPS